MELHDVTPERAEILSLRRSLRLSEEGALELRLALARERSRRRGAEAALAREHATVKLVDPEADAALDDAQREARNARADAQALEGALLGVAHELDRALSGAISLKTPADVLEFVRRVRALIPHDDGEGLPVKTAEG
jgi:hypothetical protein